MDDEPNIIWVAVKIWTLIALFRVLQFLSATISIIHWPIGKGMVILSKACEKLVQSRSDMRHLYKREIIKQQQENNDNE